MHRLHLFIRKSFWCPTHLYRTHYGYPKWLVFVAWWSILIIVYGNLVSLITGRLSTMTHLAKPTTLDLSLQSLPDFHLIVLHQYSISSGSWSIELQQEINAVGAKYIRHSVKSANGSSQLSNKDTNIPSIVKANYVEIDQLAVEKEKLAERIVQLINRARARLEHDLHKVLILQGEVDPSHGLYQGPYGTRNPVNQVLEVLKNSSSSISIADTPSTPASAGSPAHPNKSE